MCRFAGIGNEKVIWKWGALTYNGRRKRNTCLRRGKGKTQFHPYYSLQYRRVLGNDGDVAYRELMVRDSTQNLQSHYHIWKPLLPKGGERLELYCVCQKTPRDGKPAGSQFCDLSAGLPSALHFAFHPLQFFQVHCWVGILCRKYHNVTSHSQPPQHSRSEFI